MLIRDQLRRQGEQLFRLRNSLPALLLPLALLALWESRWLAGRLGPTLDEAREWLCFAISAAGLALRFAVAGCVPRGTSGRRSRSGLASPELNTTGVYSLLRHPLYLANFLLFAGFVLAIGNLWFAAIACLSFWLYYERIALAEEDFLERSFGERYLAWARATPAVVPDLRLWQPPALPYHARSALKREYRTLCATLLAFGLLGLAQDSLARGHLVAEAGPVALLGCAALSFAVLRFLHKRTRWLHVRGR